MKIFTAKNAKWIIAIGVFFSAIAPWLLTRNWGLDSFGKPADVGSTFGGISGPILSLLGLVLIWLTFEQQFKATLLLEQEKEENKKSRYFEILREYISQFKQSFNKIDIKKVIDSLIQYDDVIGGGYLYGNYVQDKGENERMKYLAEHPEEQDESISYHYVDPSQIDKGYIKDDIKGYFTLNSDAKNYWYAIQVAYDIITQVDDKTKLSEDQQKILANNFIFYYRVTGLTYAEEIYEFARTGIKVSDYSINVFQKTEFYKKIIAIDNFCNRDVTATKL